VCQISLAILPAAHTCTRTHRFDTPCDRHDSPKR
jgi:hypothetical protein